MAHGQVVTIIGLVAGEVRAEAPTRGQRTHKTLRGIIADVQSMSAEVEDDRITGPQADREHRVRGRALATSRVAHLADSWTPTFGPRLGSCWSERPSQCCSRTSADVDGARRALDPESLATADVALLRRDAPVIERHGGTVEKFIGDEVMAVFGVPQVHEDDALRASAPPPRCANGARPLNDDLDATWGRPRADAYRRQHGRGRGR